MSTYSPALRSKGAVNPGQMYQEILLSIPRQWTSPQHRGCFAATNSALAHTREESGRVCRILTPAPRYPDAPAGNLEIAVPCPMVGQACCALLFKRE